MTGKLNPSSPQWMESPPLCTAKCWVQRFSTVTSNLSHQGNFRLWRQVTTTLVETRPCIAEWLQTLDLGLSLFLIEHIEPPHIHSKMSMCQGKSPVTSLQFRDTWHIHLRASCEASPCLPPRIIQSLLCLPPNFPNLWGTGQKRILLSD